MFRARASPTGFPQSAQRQDAVFSEEAAAWLRGHWPDGQWAFILHLLCPRHRVGPLRSLRHPQHHLWGHHYRSLCPDEENGHRGAGSVRGHASGERGNGFKLRVPLNRVPSCLPETEIYGLLKAQGPHKALHIAQALGLKTAKEVNRDLYAMRSMHLLTLDQKSNAWGVYQPGRPLPAAHTWTGQRGRAATRNRKTQHLALAGLLPTSPLPAPPRHPPPPGSLLWSW